MNIGSIKNALITCRIPRRLRSRFRNIDGRKMAQLHETLREHYFRNVRYSSGLTYDKYLETPEGRGDCADHTVNRLFGFRTTVIPWLDTLKPLSTGRVLEIGSGTGCSTLALAEQGASVIGVDIDEPSLIVARKRAELYGVSCRLVNDNAVNIGRFAGEPFDFIIFFAALEHMTIDERIRSIGLAWEMLPPGGLLVVIETPNRLWFTDEHTSLLPFFHWLPDEMAFRYAERSPRTNFYRFGRSVQGEVPMAFHRLGRGVSFHEFELAMGAEATANVVGDLDLFLTKRMINPVNMVTRRFSRMHRYHLLLRSVLPSVSPAFFHKDLNLAVLKR